MLSNNMFTQEAKDKIASFFIGRNVLMCGKEVCITDISDTWSSAWFTMEANYDKSFAILIENNVLDPVLNDEQLDVCIVDNTSPVAMPNTYLMKPVNIGGVVLEEV